jgi:hypothetical protein
MYPLSDMSLSLPGIARHWVRDLRQHPPENEVLDYLIQSYFDGDFETFASPNGDIISRRQALRAVALSAPHPGFIICPTSESVPLSTTPTDDGGVVVDLNLYVVLPDEENDWSADVVEAASKVLRACSLNAFSKSFIIGMRCQSLTKDQFAAFCDLRGHRRPGFWFADQSGSPALSFGGRPSAMRLIEVELRRRAENGQLAPKITEESKALEVWARKHLPPDLPAPAAKSIANALRNLYKQLRGSSKVPKT